MCNYTIRWYARCWCFKPHLSFANRCPASLRSAEAEPCPCPYEFPYTGIPREPVNELCEYHLSLQPAPASDPVEENANRRHSEGNINTQSQEASRPGLGIRETKSFPLSRNSDPIPPQPGLQRSKTSATQPEPIPHIYRSKTQPLQQNYTPILPHHLQRSATSAAPRPKQNNIKKVAIRDSKGFFIPPEHYLGPPPPSSPLPSSPQPLQRANTTSFSSHRTSILPSTPEVRRSDPILPTASPHTPQTPPQPSTPIFSSSPQSPRIRSPVPDFEPSFGSPPGQDREKARRRSNRVSYVYEKNPPRFNLDGFDGTGARESGLFPSPLQIMRREIEREKLERIEGGKEEGETEEEVFYSDYDDVPPKLDKRKERRESVRGHVRREEGVAYGGSEYEPGQDNVDAYLQDALFSQPRAEQQPKLEMEEDGRKKQNRSSTENKGNVVTQEEDIVYSDSEYETDYVDTDDSN